MKKGFFFHLSFFYFIKMPHGPIRWDVARLKCWFASGSGCRHCWFRAVWIDKAANFSASVPKSCFLKPLWVDGAWSLRCSVEKYREHKQQQISVVCASGAVWKMTGTWRLPCESLPHRWEPVYYFSLSDLVILPCLNSHHFIAVGYRILSIWWILKWHQKWPWYMLSLLWSI